MPALIRRVASIGPSCAVPALALGELLERGFQIGLGEVGPQGLAEDELGVGALPEQEVAGALLAAGPDDQVGVRLAGGVELVAEALLVDVVGGTPAATRARAASTISARPE